MTTFYRVSFFCHGCGLENTFTYHCANDGLGAMQRAASLSCPSGCNSSFEEFEVTSLYEVAWQAAISADNAIFH